ncbi:MAG TPA: glycoside hydrolase family 95 protein, partial [Longimicrobiaceae bacterium]
MILRRMRRTFNSRSTRSAGRATAALLAATLAACAPPGPQSAPRATIQPAGPSEARTLWYAAPAAEWVDALPVGNGRLGAMVFGGTGRERIQLNEESVWSGGPIREMNPRTRQHIAEARRLLFAGRYVEAEALVNDSVLRPGGTRSSHQTLGDLWLDFGEGGAVEGYRRALSLDSALAVTTYRAGGVEIRREVFASAPDQVVVVRIECGAPGCPAFDVGLSRPEGATVETVGSDGLRMYGRAAHEGENPGVRFEARLGARTEGGRVSSTNGGLRVEGGRAATILVSGATDYGGANPREETDATLARAAARDYDELRAAHVADHQRLFDRVRLSLGGSGDLAALPTDERLERVKQGGVDPDLVELYFQFGRYLLIGSSRPGDLAANLQGIWNEHIDAPWGSDYHVNINIQMNYWPAEPT